MLHVDLVLASFDVTTFIKNGTTTAQGWFSGLTLLAGLVCIFIGIWQTASGLWSQGKKQTNWIVTIGLILFGGALTATGGGFEFMKDMAGGGRKTIEDLGKGKSGAIMLLDYAKFYLPFK